MDVWESLVSKFTVFLKFKVRSTDWIFLRSLDNCDDFWGIVYGVECLDNKDKRLINLNT